MEFNDRGNINMQGIVPIELDNFKDFFVNNLDNSAHRKNIYDGFIKLLNEVVFEHISSQFTRVWVDGSFCTNKELPNDIDFVILFNADLDNLEKSSICMRQLEAINFRRIGEDNNCDVYVTYDTDTLDEDDCYGSQFEEVREIFEEQFLYWRDFFSKDRDRNGKPIFELKFEGGKLI